MGPVRIMMVPCAPRRCAGIGEAAAVIERLRSSVRFADLEPQPLEATSTGMLFGYRRQGRGHTSASLLRAYLHILKLRWIGESKVGMPERLVVLPRDQIEAVALVQPGQSKDRPNPLDLVVCHRRTTRRSRGRSSPIHEVSIELPQNLDQLITSSCAATHAFMLAGHVKWKRRVRPGEPHPGSALPGHAGARAKIGVIYGTRRQIAASQPDQARTAAPLPRVQLLTQTNSAVVVRPGTRGVGAGRSRNTFRLGVVDLVGRRSKSLRRSR